MTPGIVYATLAYMAWGLFPLYFRQVAHVPALEVVVHRTVVEVARWSGSRGGR